MPAKYTLKQYLAGHYYHLYNHGVDKTNIFTNDSDYQTFTNYLSTCLSPPPDPNSLKKTISLKGVSFQGIPRQPKNLHHQITLVAFRLMPNHFHLLVKQKYRQDIQIFMRSLGTRYVTYFNKAHQRIGPLFQGAYKAVLVKQPAHLIHLSRYFHHAMNIVEPHRFDSPYSSYPYYLGQKTAPWINPQPVIDLFNSDPLLSNINHNSYQHFVEQSTDDSTTYLGDLIIE